MRKLAFRNLSIAAALLVAACAPEASPLEEEQVTEAEYAWLGSDPQAWRAFWYSLYAADIEREIESLPEQPSFEGTRTVLLVPGTTIGGEFFAPMAARLARDGFEPVIWAPPDLFTESLTVGASRLEAAIEQTLAERSEDRLHVVAECDGGVAARYYAQRLGGAATIDQLVTFVSAHH